MRSSNQAPAALQALQRPKKDGKVENQTHACFFDIRIIHKEFLPQGPTVNHHFYLNVLERLGKSHSCKIKDQTFSHSEFWPKHSSGFSAFLFTRLESLWLFIFSSRIWKITSRYSKTYKPLCQLTAIPELEFQLWGVESSSLHAFRRILFWRR